MPGPPPGLSGVELSRWVIAACTDPAGLGFAAAGVCEASPTTYARELQDWLRAGQNGEMAYLADQLGERLDPTRVLAGAKSVIMVADQYAPRGGQDEPEGTGSPDEPVGRIARYARGRDYHDVIRRRLHRLGDALRAAFPGHRTRTFVDSAPVLEREYAQRAGLGWRARNTMIIHPRLGSYLLLGGFYTTLELPPPPEQETTSDHCGTCTRCIDACPTGAISAPPYSEVDARRCISYLTIEHAGAIRGELQKGMGDWVFGCDMCQEVCPHNSARGEDIPPAIRDDYRPIRSTLPLLTVLNWGKAERAALGASAMKRASLEMLKRNALIALGNHPPSPGDPRVLATLDRVSRDEAEPELLRRTADEVLARLRS
jgi:epoxyqueuosine reductase